MPPLTHAQLDTEYRLALRRLAQAGARAQTIEDYLLHVLGRLMTITQEITFELEGLQRERRTQAAGHEITHLLAHGNHD